jgi:glycerol kinase
MLYNIHTLEWDEEILTRLDIPRSMLPEVKPSSYVYGLTTPGIFSDEIPIAGVAGDQQAALFGQGCFESGECKNTYGTGCFLLMNTGEEAIQSNHGLLTTIAASDNNKVQYALEGSVFVAGAAIQWLRDELQIIKTAAESEECAMEVENSNGVYVVPAFSGLGAPYWDQYARGTIIGITRGANKNHIVRAVLESIAYEVYDVIKAMEQDASLVIKHLKVDGGACANNFLMQFQADILDTTVMRPDCIETTALGASYLAGLATGFWKDKKEIKENWALSRTFTSNMEKEERQALIAGWKGAVKRSFDQAK